MNRTDKGTFKPKGNTFEIKDNNIYCYHADGTLLFFTDEKYKHLVMSNNWCKSAKGYCTTHINGKQIGIHRVIAGASGDCVVDHINGNKKDNRASNLRICNKSQNAYNTPLNKNNKSGIKGVWFRKDTKRWCAEIKHNGKKIALGCYETLEDATKARKIAENKYMGEFAYGN